MVACTGRAGPAGSGVGAESAQAEASPSPGTSDGRASIPEDGGAAPGRTGAGEKQRRGGREQGREGAERGKVTRSRYTMGTTASATIEDAGAEHETWSRIAEEALDRLDEVDREASLYKPESDLSRLNAEAHARPYRCGGIVTELMDASERFVGLTDGAFDPTIKPVMDQLGFYREIGSRPDPGGLPGALAKSGWGKLEWHSRAATVRFRVAGMALDFGGIAKGHALDRAVAVLRARGVRRAQLELGRSWYFLGSDQTDSRQRFRLAVAAPFRPGEEGIAGTVLVPEGSVATSSPLGQTRGAGTELVGHIVDPERGPVRSPVLAAVVWAPSGTDADALTKAFVLRGPHAAGALEGRVRYEAVVIQAQGVPRPSASLTGRMRRIAKSRGRDVYATPGIVWEPLAGR